MSNQLQELWERVVCAHGCLKQMCHMTPSEDANIGNINQRLRAAAYYLHTVLTHLLTYILTQTKHALVFSMLSPTGMLKTNA